MEREQRLNLRAHRLNTAPDPSINLCKRPVASKPPTIPDSPLRRRDAEQTILMREVDDAVRQDQVSGAAKRYGLAVGAALLVILLLFGAWLIWHNRQESRLEQRSEDLVLAIDELEAGNDRVADSALEAMLPEADPGVAAVARLLRAGIALQQNRPDEAVAHYNEVAADGATPGPYREFAAIRAVAATYDDLQPQQVIDRLGPLAVPGSPWFGSAGELVALAHLAAGREEQAGTLLAAIAKDENVPDTLRARTRQLAGLLGYDAVEDVEQTLAQMAGDGAADAVAPAPASAAQ